MDKKGQKSIKQTIRKNYGKLALTETNEGACCAAGCCSVSSPAKAAADAGYDRKELEVIPETSVLGVGCGAPVRFADLKKGETVADLGSGAGIDVFLSANKVGPSGKVIGVDMTDGMLARATKNAKDNGYSNVVFKKGDIEKRIPVDDGSVDAVISNCVINLTIDKVAAFKEIHRILKRGGRMIISDLVADKKAGKINPELWSSCIDGATTKQDYISAIMEAGFDGATVLEDREYVGGEMVGGRRISSVIVRAVKN